MNTTPIPTSHHHVIDFAMCSARSLERARRHVILLTLFALAMISAGCGQDDVQAVEAWGIEDAQQVDAVSPAKPTLSPEVLPRNLNPDDPNLDGSCGVSLCPTPWEDKPTQARSCREVFKVDEGDGLKVISNRLKLYDERGRFVELREGDLAVVQNEYDERGLLVWTKSRGGDGLIEHEQRYVYNEAAQLIASTRRDEEATTTTTWTYDELGRVSSSHDIFTYEDREESRWRFYRYEGYVAKTYFDSNDNGRLDVGIDEVFTDYTYDASGKLLWIKPYSEAYGAPYVISKYNYNQQDKLISIVNQRLDDGSSTVYEDFSYDSQGRLALIRALPNLAVSVNGDEVLIRDRLELKRTDGAVTQALIYGSMKQEPVVSLQLSGSMCERSLLDWRRFLMYGLIRGCGSAPCITRSR